MNRLSNIESQMETLPSVPHPLLEPSQTPYPPMDPQHHWRPLAPSAPRPPEPTLLGGVPGGASSSQPPGIQTVDVELNESSLYIEPSERFYQDFLFSFFYLLCLAFMFSMGIQSLSTPLPSPMHGTILGNTIYGTLRQSSDLLLSACATAILIGVCWLYFLKSFVRPIFLFSLYITPLACIVMSLSIFTNTLAAKAQPSTVYVPEYDWMIALAISFFIGGIGLGSFNLTKRRQIEQTIHVMELSCMILKNNPSLFGLGLIVLLSNMTFSILWLTFFVRQYLNSTVAENRWTLAPGSYYTILYFVFMYLWTVAILNNIERATIGGVVGEWYFKKDPDFVMSEDNTIKNLKCSLTKSFGSVALAGLIMSTVQFLKLMVRYIRKQSRHSSWSIMGLLDVCLSCVGGFVDLLSSYTLVHIGFSGDSFMASSRYCTQLFRRNLVIGLASSLFAKLIVKGGTLLISTGAASYVFFEVTSRQRRQDSDRSDTPQGGAAAVAASVTWLFVWYFLETIGHVFQNTVDATFICYIIDLDTNQCHQESAHKVFKDSPN
ncbi:plasma-membrane choline transporter-domain-containing protein [Polychytrium aggregatum]|uniref:plasma-membrane choline transporter-domain-containing protein n=1 Tax=Polychytrium aggregatum TaxID=110093 RepID=UPI0022FE8AFE|nr:plasma-membrane choline transporter-domain-containing protein [Polychytrium aggregatum]KAI9206359.1 plasma-membrane choline transporter-domain-containing protein [Polychytrium aggregatum]